MPAFLELILDQGTDFSRDLTLTDDFNNANINVVGYIVCCNARKSYSSFAQNTTPDIIFNTSLVDAQNGAIRISQTAANTATYYPRRYWYDVLTISAAGQRSRVLEGIITVTPSVS
jgi:hypothetical protein